MKKVTLKLFFLIVFIILYFTQLCFAADKAEHQRIISLTPHITQILFDVGAGDSVVGTPFTYINEHPDIAKIGDFMNPSIEKIVALKPTIIIGSNASARPELLNKLKELGYSVELVDENYLVDIYRSIMIIGTLTGKEDNAKKLISAMQTQIGKLENSIINKPRKTVFYQIWDNPLITIGKGSYLQEILMKAHLRPITIKADGYSRISIEEVLKADPDIILIPYDSTMNVDKETLIKMWDRYPQMKAVKNHQVLIINSENLHMPGSRLVDGLKDVIEIVWDIK